MPSTTDYARKRKYRANEYRGERTIGGNLVWAGTNVLDKHLFVHRVTASGFDWGPDADVDRACQLAIALLAPLKGVDEAVETYHLFAENFVTRELTGDEWTISRRDLRSPDYRTRFDGRDYPTNTAPDPDDVGDVDAVDLESITYAEEIALASKYEDVLWDRGNRRENLQRLCDIWAGEVDPAEDSVRTGVLYHLLDGISSNARRTLASEFETMGDLAGWACYGRSHSLLDGISTATAQTIRSARPDFIRYFGGEEYIPAYKRTSTILDDEQQTFDTPD